MVLSKAATLAIRGSRTCRTRIAEELNVSDNTMFRWLSQNEKNGDLTKAIVLKVIREETGLSDDQILEDEKEPELVSK